MKKTGLMALVLAMAMVLVLFAGCTSKDNNTEASTTPPATATSSSAATEPAGPEEVTLTALLYSNPSWPFNAYWTIWDWIKEATGATFDIQVPPGEIGQAVTLAVASGELTDLAYGYEGTPKALGVQGALVNFKDHLDKMPNLKAFIDNNPEVVNGYLASDGGLYSTPAYGSGLANARTWLYRKDIFEKNNIKVPATWDELYNSLTELKKLYPDSIPFIHRGGLEGMLNDVAPAFDTYARFYPDENNKVKYGPLDDNYKKMIEMLHKFYADGLMAKDFLSVDTARWQELISTDKSFVTNDYAVRIDVFKNAIKQKDPETKFNLTFLAPPAGWAGGPQALQNNTMLTNGWMVNKNSDKVDAALKVLDWFYSDEGKTLVSWGKEGETYEVVNGEKKYFTDKFSSYDDLRNKTGISTDGTYTLFDMDAKYPLMGEELANAYKNVQQYFRPIRNLAPTKPEQDDLFYTTWSEVLSHVNEQVAKFIIGSRDLGEWDAFKQEVVDLGVDKVIAAHQSNLDELIASQK